ncbi:MAG: right-handed parallel beta-helix repeat-containing protein [Bacteroidales bacterium]|nr:right-handed parallel beta-helix repeat-containing protein [Bacteroidales bacterium]
MLQLISSLKQQFIFITCFLLLQACNNSNSPAVKEVITSSKKLGLSESLKQNIHQFFKDSTTVEIFVSPHPNHQKIGSKKFPFTDINVAVETVKKIKTFFNDNRLSYYITLLEGTYFLENPLFINYEDTCSQQSALTIRGVNGKSVILSGEKIINPRYIQPLSSLHPYQHIIEESLKERIYVIDLNQLNISNIGSFGAKGFGQPLIPSPIELLINDEPLQISRWPNYHFAKIDSVFNPTTFQCNDMKAERWTHEKNAWAIGFWRWWWADHHLTIHKIDTINNTIHLNEPPPQKHYITKKGHWYVNNVLAELDNSGEYYIDFNNKFIYFIPPENSSKKDLKVSISIFGNENNSLLNIKNARNITIDNISISNTRASGVTVSKSNNINFTSCNVKNTGTYGISIDGFNCSIKNSFIANTGAFGVKLNGGNRKMLIKANNVVDNTCIQNTGRNYLNYQPCIQLEGVGQTIKNCDISNAPSIGILFFGNYHLIEKNHIHNVCRKIDDGGAIYCGRDWALRGNTIKHNIIHHVTGDNCVRHSKGVHGVYIDDYASGITVYGNVFYYINSYGIMNGGGRDNIMQNNIMIQCGAAHATDTRGRLYLFHNQMYSQLEKLDYKKSPWKHHFPNLAKMSERKTKFNETFKIESIVRRFPKSCSILRIKYYSDNVPQGCVFTGNIGWQNKKWIFEKRYGRCEKPSPLTYYKLENNFENLDPKFIDEQNLLLGLQKDSPVNEIINFKKIPFEEIGIQ